MTRCGKQWYRFKSDAELAIEIIARKNRRRSKAVPRRPYFCERCDGWHITKTEEKK
jgi:hypothetical protein